MSDYDEHNPHPYARARPAVALNGDSENGHFIEVKGSPEIDKEVPSVTVYHNQFDGYLVVQVDTEPDNGCGVRVYVNDGEVFTDIEDD